jgi:spore germination protein GerM
MNRPDQNKEITLEIEGKTIIISEAERKKILESINRSDTEKFYLFTRLMRIHFMLKKAVIIK